VQLHAGENKMRRSTDLLAGVLTGLLPLAFGVFGATGGGKWGMDVVRQSADGMEISCQLPDDLNAAMKSGETGEFVQEYVAPDGSRQPFITRWVVLPAGMKGELAVREQALDGASPAVIGRPVIWRGVRLAPVMIMPQQHSEESLTLDIRFVPDKDGVRHSEIAPRPLSPQQARILDMMTLNPPRQLSPRRDLAAEDIAHILLLYPEALEDETALTELDGFVDWKERMGFKVTKLAVDTDVMDALDIKDMIADYYDDNPPLDYLVIVGDDRFPDPFPDDGQDPVYDEEMFFPGLLFDYGIFDSFSDLLYTTMDGENDLTPDIPLGRFWVPTAAKLAGVLRRSVEYEKDPYAGPDNDYAWMGHALVAMESDSMFAERVDLARWEARKLEQMGLREVDLVWDKNDTLSGEDEIPIFEEGVTLALADGWALGTMKPWESPRWTDPAETGRMNPFIITNCPYYSKWLLYEFFGRTEVDAINGAVGALTTTHRDQSHNITIVLGGAVLGLSGGITRAGDLGVIAATYMEPLLAMGAEDDSTFLGDLKGLHLYGDPTLDIFTGVPVTLTAGLPDAYNVGATGVTLTITDSDGAPVADVTVCIRQPDNFQYVAWTDEAGLVVFTIPEGLTEGNLQITAHRHNCRPVVADVPVDAPDVNLVLDAAGFDDSDIGDNDGLLRNGEEAALILKLLNAGAADAMGVTATLSSDSPYLELSDAELEFGDIATGETVAYQGEATLTTAAECPGGTLLRIGVSVHSGEGSWESAFEIISSGPAFGMEEQNLGTERFTPGSEGAAIDVGIRNIGDLAASEIAVRLVSLDTLVTVTDGERVIPDLNPDDTGNPDTLFAVSVSRFVFRGDSVRLALDITADHGFAQRISFLVRVEGEREGEPLGPDDYGYICYDSGDDRFANAPIYRWREINWDVDGWEFNGTRLDLGDIMGDPGAWNTTVRVPLPISFRFYGQDVDTIVVSSNGWLGLRAADTVFTSGSNQRIPGHGSPDAQVCVYWDDLRNPLNSYYGVFYHCIEDEGLFVVEWSGVAVTATDSITHYVSFQALLFDSEKFPTPTRDGEITLQYQKYDAVLGESLTSPFATVGLRNWDGSGGLQYTFGNEYPEAAHPLEDDMALKFTTVLSQLGAMQGRVVRLEAQDEGIADAILIHPRFPGALTTEADGSFFLSGLLPGQYQDVTVNAARFNGALLTIGLAAGDTVDAGLVSLTHPVAGEHGMNPMPFDRLSLRPDGSELLATLTLANDGNGPLDYRARIVNYDGSEPAPVAAGEIDSLYSITRDVRVNGFTRVDSVIYLPGRNQSREGNDGHRIYGINLSGQLVSDFRQPLTAPSRGILNLTWDGAALWGSYLDKDTGEIHLIKLDLQGTLIKDLTPPLPSISSLPLVFEQERGIIYAGDANLTHIVELDTANGGVLDSIPLHVSGRRMKVTGLAWNPYDTDGMNLYILEDSTLNDTAFALLHKMDVNSGEVIRVGSLTGRAFLNGGHLGLVIIWDIYFQHTVAVTMEDDGYNSTGDSNISNDMIRFYDLGPNLSLLGGEGIRNRTGSIPAGESGRIQMLMKAEGWPEDICQFGLQIIHNAVGETLLAPVNLTLTDTSDIPSTAEPLPSTFGLQAVYPNPFNAQIRIDFNVDALRPVSLKLYDLAGRKVADIYEGDLNAGRHRMAWDGSGFASGIYIIKLESAGRFQTAKLALVK